MKGIRVFPKDDGWLDSHQMAQPGAYGRIDVQKVLAAMAAKGHAISADYPWCDWEVCAPDGHGGRLDPRIHTVVEHEDCTITVNPSIDMSRIVQGGYHGWLKRGEWS